MNTAQLLASVGIPLLVAIFSSPKWPGGVRAFLAFALCIGLAFWQARGQFGPDTLENILKVFAAVQALYLGLLKHIGLPELERGSSDAWKRFLGGLADGLGKAPPAPSVRERLAELDRLVAEGIITKAEFNDRRLAILEEV